MIHIDPHSTRGTMFEIAFYTLFPFYYSMNMRPGEKKNENTNNFRMQWENDSDVDRFKHFKCKWKFYALYRSYIIQELTNRWHIQDICISHAWCVCVRVLDCVSVDIANHSKATMYTFWCWFAKIQCNRIDWFIGVSVTFEVENKSLSVSFPFSLLNNYVCHE